MKYLHIKPCSIAYVQNHLLLLRRGEILQTILGSADLKAEEQTPDMNGNDEGSAGSKPLRAIRRLCPPVF
jgi:hypothetical protein